MKTRLINMDNAPNEHELVSLLGEISYKYYLEICETTISLLSPNLEIWNFAGRRGKYWHGYRIDKKSITVDIYLYSEFDHLTCEFHFIKRFFSKIIKHRYLLNNDAIQKDIDYSIQFNKEYGGGYFLSIIIRDDETFLDTQKIIKIVSSSYK